MKQCCCCCCCCLFGDILPLHLSSLAPSLTLAYFFKLSIKLSTGETLYIAEQQIILSKAAGSILELSPHAPMQTFTNRNVLGIRELKEKHVTSTVIDPIAIVAA